ncbi:MAG: 4'-phosphopantetheinyl transferase superfamily protein [Syntrophobacterales bacterium]|nr:4'-phosphopantetheinyl transferase superfamily protein [Syntrophobacterales bacterium]
MPDTPNIQQLFPERVFTECCRIEDKHYALRREEGIAVEKAVTGRRNEFGAGRMCARRALESLGMQECVLARNSDGSTAWPPGIVGAISHSDLWCGAAVARQSDYPGVGFDIETADRVTYNIAKRVLTDSEMDWVDRQAANESRKWFTLIFSAKESIYKCLFPLVGKGIRFHDAEIIPHVDDFSFDVRLTDKIASRIPPLLSLRGRYLLYEGEMFTGIVLIK